MPDPVLPPGRAFEPLPEQWVEGDHPTANPDGVTVSNVDYTPKTQEEKAALIHVEMVEVVEVEPTEPYPTGGPTLEDDDENFYQAHGYRRTPNEEAPDGPAAPL